MTTLGLGCSYLFQVRLGLFKLREQLFLFLKLARVNAAAAAADSDRMLKVQHLVVHQVFDGVARRVTAVEYAADHDGVVGGVIMAEQTARLVLAPGEQWTAEQSVKEAAV